MFTHSPNAEIVQSQCAYRILVSFWHFESLVLRVTRMNFCGQVNMLQSASSVFGRGSCAEGSTHASNPESGLQSPDLCSHAYVSPIQGVWSMTWMCARFQAISLSFSQSGG